MRALDAAVSRYAIASLVALGTDFGLTMLMRTTTPLSLATCAAISFIVVGTAFYFVHEHWSFRREGSKSSTGRLARNLVVLTCAFSSRVGVIAALETLHEPNFLLGVMYFGFGAGVSFAINYLANRYWVFRGV